MTKFDQLSPLLFRTIDIGSVISSAYIAYLLRFDTFSVPERFRDVIIIAALLVAFFTSYKAAYSSWRGHYGFQLVGKLITAWTLAGGTFLTIVVFMHQGEYFSRLWLGYWWLIGLAIATGCRAAVYGYLAYYRAKGHNNKKVAIVGDPKSCSKVKLQLAQATWSGFKVTVLIDQFNNASDLPKTLDTIDSTVDEIWLATPVSNGEWVKSALFHLRNHTQNIRYVPDVADLRLLNHKISQVAGLQVLDMSLSPLDGLTGLTKRLEDIVLGTLIFVLISPVMASIALLVKCTSKGPILFKQKRNGIDGKSIKVYKFRSMYVHEEKGEGITQAKINDNRITPLGRFLRRTSLDELPQFYNVIQGRMSIVGPRPHAIQHNEYYRELVESYMRRHKVKPGITGWAQVNGYRGETDTLDKMEKRVEYDLYYIDNWSFWFDIRIIVMTIFKGFANKNAY